MSSHAELDKLKALINAEPDILEGVAGSGDVNEASLALSRFAADRGIRLTPQEVASIFAARGRDTGAAAELLDDDVLESVSGGGSPYCIFTKGCYCIFTK